MSKHENVCKLAQSAILMYNMIISKIESNYSLPRSGNKMVSVLGMHALYTLYKSYNNRLYVSNCVVGSAKGRGWWFLRMEN